MAIKFNTNYTTQNVYNTGDRGRKGVKEDYKWIVVHYTGCCDWNTGFESKAMNCCIYYRDNNVSASANFYVDSTDQVYVSVPLFEQRYAWHCGIGKYKADYLLYDADGSFCSNPTAIGVEICTCKINPSTGSAYDPDWYYDPRTYDHAVELVRYLMEEFNIDINHVVRHYDVNTIHKLCPSQFVGNDIKTYYSKSGEQNWLDFKNRLLGVPVVEPKSISAKTNKTSYEIGYTLKASDFTIKVTNTDGSVIVNPSGWSASPLKITGKSNKITVIYKNVSTTTAVAGYDSSVTSKDICQLQVVKSNNGGVNLRSDCNSNSKLIKTLNNGETCLGLKLLSNGWMYVKYLNNGTLYYGWIYKNLEAVTPGQKRVVKSKDGTLNIRTGPSSKYQKLATMGNGFSFYVINYVASTNNTWGYIWCGDTIGYCDCTDKYSYIQKK